MSSPITRRGLLAAAGATALAGCVGAGSQGSTPSGGGSASTPAATATSASSSADAGGKVPTSDRSLPLPMSGEDLSEHAVSGGPPKDGIPSIDNPKFVGSDGGDGFLKPGDIVFGVERDGVAKAYPQKILVWHEICNDTVAGDPVSVTYCPLTGTAQGFERGSTTFGVSGRLINNNLVMYDRATERWWPQILATSIPGPWSDLPTGDSLREFRVVWTTWERWKGQFPDTEVLSKDTGFARSYTRDPYGSYNPTGGYYENGNTLFERLNPDDSYHAKRVFIGTRTPDGAAAFLKDALREEKLIEGEIAGTPLLAVYDPTLDTGYVYRNPDGASFEFDGGRVVSSEGKHAPDSLPLDRALAFDAMWFAWHGYYPETAVYE